MFLNIYSPQEYMTLRSVTLNQKVTFLETIFSLVLKAIFKFVRI